MISIPGKIPIRIYPVFWFLASLIGYLNSQSILGTLIWIAVIVVSILIHEFGHALTGLFFGQTVRIDLTGFGGLTQREGPKLKLWQEFFIVLNGPLAGLLLFFLANQLYIAIPNINPILERALVIAIFINLFWTLLNLLPIYPLDGGKILSIILEAIFGFRGIKFALFISIIFAAFMGLLLMTKGYSLGGAFFFFFAFESYMSWRNTGLMSEKDRDTSLQELLKESEIDINQGFLDAALIKLNRVREQSKSGLIYISATQYAAQIYANKGLFQESYSLLMSIQKKLNPDSMRLLNQLAYRLGHWMDAIRFGEQAYQLNPAYDTAFINALCYGALGEVTPAIGWLQRSIRDGLPDIPEMLEKKEFDKIRQDPLFRQITS